MNSNYKLHSKDPLSLLIKQKNIENWEDLTSHVKALPYGRNENREDLQLVWKEQKGTCSSKHAFLKHVADLNAIPYVKLILGMYKMNHLNTPKIGDVLTKQHLNYIPEAHCYLKTNDEPVDYTSSTSDFNRIKNDILLEREIEPHQVAEFKVDFHKAYIKIWIEDHNIRYTFEDVWKFREQCIVNLTL